MLCRGTRAALAAATGALVVVATAGAKTIVGTPRADLLKGTSAADVIYGRGGNDRLLGLRGDDRLFGGAGADRIACGPGHDRVVADRRDAVASDCEHVTRPPPPPAQNPPPPLPPPLPPPPPPPSSVVPGHYVALTEQARYVHLEVYPDGRALRNLRAEFDAECSPPMPLRGPFVDVAGDVAIDPDGRFTAAATQDGGRLRLTLQGAFEASGKLSGTFRVQTAVDSGGTRYECDSGTVPFKGQRWWL